MNRKQMLFRNGCFALIFLALSAALVARAAVPSDEPASAEACQALHDEIENDFRTANHCTVDSDCKFIRLGGWYIDFGCYKYVNASTDGHALLDKIERYKDKMRCSAKINECMDAGSPACVQGKCVGKR